MAEILIHDLCGKRLADAIFIDQGEIKDTRVFVSEIITGNHLYKSRVFVPEGYDAGRIRYVMDLYNFYQQGLFIECS